MATLQKVARLVHKVSKRVKLRPKYYGLPESHKKNHHYKGYNILKLNPLSPPALFLTRDFKDAYEYEAMNSNRTRLAREHLKLSVTKPKSPFEKPIIDQVMAKKWNTIDFKDSVLVSLTRYFMKRGMIKPLKSNKKSKKSRRSKTSYRVRRNKVGRFNKKQSQSLNLFYQKKNRELKQLQSQNEILNKTEGIEEHEEYPYLELREADIDVEENTIV